MWENWSHGLTIYHRFDITFLRQRENQESNNHMVNTVCLTISSPILATFAYYYVILTSLNNHQCTLSFSLIATTTTSVFTVSATTVSTTQSSRQRRSVIDSTSPQFQSSNNPSSITNKYEGQYNLWYIKLFLKILLCLSKYYRGFELVMDSKASDHVILKVDHLAIKEDYVGF